MNRQAVLAAGGLFTLLSLVALILSGRIAPAGAGESGGMDALSVDMDTTGNAATAIGTREDCIELTAGDTFSVDITAQGIPVTHPIIAYGFTLQYVEGPLSVVSEDPRFLLASNPGSSEASFSEPLPDVDGSGAWIASAVDVASQSLPESGSGVLTRVQISIAESAPPALYEFNLTEAAHIDKWNGILPPDVLNAGYVALGVSCSGIPVSTTAPPTPTPPVAPTRTPCPPPPHDDVHNPRVIPGLTAIIYDDAQCATGAATDPSCVPSDSTLWYSFQASQNGTIRARVFANWDTTLAALQGTPGSMSLVGCNDDSEGSASKVEFQVTAGTTYYLMVGAFAGIAPGRLDLFVEYQLHATVTVDPSGVLLRLGEGSAQYIIATGGVSCSKRATVMLSVEIIQDNGRGLVARGVETFRCGWSESSWTIWVENRASRDFTAGKATIIIRAYASSFPYGGSETAYAEVSSAMKIKHRDNPR